MSELKKIQKKLGKTEFQQLTEQVMTTTHRIWHSAVIEHYRTTGQIGITGMQTYEAPIHHLAALVLKQLLADEPSTPIAAWPRKRQLKAVCEVIDSDDDFVADGTVELIWNVDCINLADQNFASYPKALMSHNDDPLAGYEYAGSILHEKDIRDFREQQSHMEVRAPKKFSTHAQPQQVFAGKHFRKCRDFLGDLQQVGDDQEAYIVYGYAPGLDTPDYAWVKLPKAICFDAVMQRFYSEDEYREAGYTEFARFTYVEEIRFALALGNDPLPKIELGGKDPREMALALLAEFNFEV